MSAQRMDPKRAHQMARKTANLQCPCCGNPVLLYVSGNPAPPDPDVAAFYRLYRKFLADGRVGLDTLEDAAEGAIEGKAGFASQFVKIEEGTE